MRFLTFIIIFFTLVRLADAQDVSPEAACDPLTSRILYEVKQGDSLSKILKTFKLAPLWCKGCSIQVTAVRNKLENTNLILENQKIELPFRCEADLVAFEVVQKETERFVLIPGTVAGEKEVQPSRAVAQAAPPTAKPVQEPTSPVEPSHVDKTLVAPVASDEPGRTSGLRFAGLYGFHSIYGTEVGDRSHASLVSTPSYGFQVDWSIPWSNEWRSNIGLAQRFIQFRKASVGNLSDSGNNVGGFWAGLERKWTSTSLKIDVGAEQALGVRATGAQSIVLDPFTVPFAEISLGQILHRSGPFEFAAALEYRYLGTSKTDSYDVKSGSAYGGGFSVSQQLEHLKVDVRVDLRNEFQNSTIVEHDVKHLELQVGITIPLGGGTLKAPPR